MSSPKSAGTSPSPAPSSVGGGNVSKFGTVIPNRVFVGGISGSTTEQDLLELFSNYGNVKSTKVINDRSGLSKGYGFVTFETEEEARRLTQQADNIMLKDRKLNIAPAVKKQVTDYAGLMKAYSPGRLDGVVGGGAVLFSPAAAYYQQQQQLLAAANGQSAEAVAAHQAMVAQGYPLQAQQAAVAQAQAQQAAALAAAATNGTSAAATQPHYAQPQTTQAFVYPHMYYPHYQLAAAQQQQQQQLYQQQVAAAQQQQWSQQQSGAQWRWLQQQQHPAYAAAAAQQAALAAHQQQQPAAGAGVGYISADQLYATQQTPQYILPDPSY